MHLENYKLLCAPSKNSAETTKISFYTTLNKQIKSVLKKQKLICIGDFNASSSTAWTTSSFLREDKVIVNSNGERFHKLFNTKSTLCLD